MTDVFFSIVIPTYNRSEFLGATIQSVLDQEFKNFEILIIDDESTDNTEDIVSQFTDTRIQYFRKKNGERAAARNYGIKRASGQYITFLDSDDLLRKDHFLTAWGFITNFCPDIFHLGYDVVDAQGNVIRQWKALPKIANNKLIEGNFLSCLGVFVRWTILEDHLFNEDRDLSGSEDYELWLRLSALYPIYTHNKSTAMLVNHDFRSVVTIDANKLIKRIELLWHYILNNQEFVNRYKSKLRTLYAYRDIYLALHLALLSHFKTITYLKNALKKDPTVILNIRFWVVIFKIFFH